MISEVRICENIKIVSGYRTVVGELSHMFEVMGLHAETEAWRVDGVGSCSSISGRGHSEYGLIGSEKDFFVQLREDKNRYQTGKSLIGCPYHRGSVGCIINDLKAPICISHIEYPSMFNNRFRIDGNLLQYDIEWMLNIILTNEPVSPWNNLSEFCHDALFAIRQMTRYVKSFSVLKDTDRKRWNRYLIL